MNILIIPSFYPNEDQPLLGSFFKEQAVALSEIGHHVVVLNASFQDRKHIHSSLNNKIRKLHYSGVVEYAYNIPALGLWHIPKICSKVFWHNVNRLWKCVENKNFDIIHVHSYYPAGIAARKLSQHTHIPLVYTEHSSGVVFHNLSAEHERQFRELMMDSNKVISVSPNLKLAMEKYIDKNCDIEVIPNMVNTELFQFVAHKKTDTYTFVTVGRLDENKRIDWIIKAFHELIKDNDKMMLRIVGDGVQKKNLVNLVRELNLDDKVVFEGNCSREDVARILQNADSFVLDSKVETFGVVYIEALACGLPVVIPEWNKTNIDISNDNCVIIGDDTIESLVDAMQQVYDKRENLDSYLISKNCIENYSGINIARRVTHAYHEVLNDEGEVNNRL